MIKILKKIYSSLHKKDDVTYYWKKRQKALECKSQLRKAFYQHSLNKIHTRFNASIPLSAKVASMPHFPHGLNGIFISMGAQIGHNCVIFHQVTIGSNTLGDSNNGAPIIGDDVYIGVGAKIIGNVTIGNGVRIGANCVVVKDVPDYATIVLQAPRIIEHGYNRDNSFVPYIKK